MKRLTALLGAISMMLFLRPPASSPRGFSGADRPPFVSLGPGGKLTYATTARGDRIADFSYAGYRGGGIEPPYFPVRASLEPTGHDDTPRLQRAIDDLQRRASDLQPQALSLSPGVFHLNSPLKLCGSGIVLRGSGMHSNGTVLELGGIPHPAIVTTGCIERASNALKRGTTTTLAPHYVPSGTRAIEVVAAAGIHPGDTVMIERPVTPRWVTFMGMNALTRNGKPEIWLRGVLRTERFVRFIRGNTLCLDVPLTDDYDPAYGGGVATRVTSIRPAVRLHEVGIEDMSIVSPALRVQLRQAHYDGIVLADVEDAWIRDVALREVTSGVDIRSTSRRVTVENIDYHQSVPIEGAAKPFVFSVAGTQILVRHVRGSADQIFYYATQARTQGPNVLSDCEFAGNGRIQPHQRWATGLLVENCSVPGGGIDLQNRGELGSGHGWPIGWSVLWNNRAGSFVVQDPPGARNWSIGGVGAFERVPMPRFDGARNGPLPSGTIASSGKMVEPRSLYAQQLRERLNALSRPHAADCRAEQH